MITENNAARHSSPEFVHNPIYVHNIIPDISCNSDYILFVFFSLMNY